MKIREMAILALPPLMQAQRAALPARPPVSP
jgi:hypothetical protein